ncbi:MAG: C13 family peptidase, partial [Candidatus Heimdallarchaeaceae archaeon]
IVEDTDTTDVNGDYMLILRDLLTSTIPCTIKVEKGGYTTIYRDTYLYPSTPTYFDIEWEVTQTCNGYVYDHMGDALSSATVKLIRMSDSAVLESDDTSVSGYYTFSEDVQENLYCKIQVEKTNYETQYVTMNCDEQTTYTSFRSADTTVDKIAVFLYATDLTDSTFIESYGEQLENDEGFDTIMYYEDEEDWEEAIIVDLDGNETNDDFVFLYIAGHGNYDDKEENSYLRIDPSTNTYMYSDELVTCLNALESDNIFILIFSCHAGGFEEDLAQSGRFIITESDCDTVAYLMDFVPDESVFSYYFFYRLACGDSGSSAYETARTLTISYYEENIEGGEYDEEPQYPMKNDQIAYTWFEWW